TAAVAQDGKVIGVILSGTRDDGTAGLAVIKSCGGRAIVQDPAEAMYPGMPASAIAHVAVDVVVRSDLIAETIVRLVNGNVGPLARAGAERGPSGIAGASGPQGPATVADADDDPERDGDSGNGEGADLAGSPPGSGDPQATADVAAPGRNPGTVTSTCPECGGVLEEHQEAGFTQWRCRVGHRYSPESLADAQGEGVEAAMWAAVRALDDREALLRRIADQLEARGHSHSAQSFRSRAREAGAQADAVRTAVGEAAETTLQKVSDSDAVEADRRRAV
ncbi:MAG TPA: chemotaxis protein CheB, partial [Solirubrobacteraceae bacterium]|nr:chemotaxis protein CheB [Solirubrobacteraceae bacterium]